MKKSRKICVLGVISIFALTMLPLSVIAPPPPWAQPFWRENGNKADQKDVLGTTNDEDLRIITNKNIRMVITSDGNVGIGTTKPGTKLDVEVSSGGAATIGHSSNSASGNCAIAIGYKTTASGNNSTAMGRNSTASGKCSTAMGGYTIASGRYSTAMGWIATASGIHATAMGSSTNASSAHSTAMGYNTTASGVASTAMGYITTASGDESTAMGLKTIASGNYSTALGVETTASGWRSTAMGIGITVQGTNSFGIGLDTNTRTITQTNTMAIMGGNVGIGTVSPNYKLSIGDGTNERIHFSGSTSPSNPPSGSVVIYFDGTDLFAKDSGGVVVTIANFP
jgi:hypothetical protein